MWVSPVAGDNDDAADRDHIGDHLGLENHTSGDSWNEGFATYISVAIAESLGEPDPHLPEMSSGVFDLLSGGARVDNPREKGWQQTYGSLSEELAIAGLLWELHANWLGREGLWATLRRKHPRPGDVQSRVRCAESRPYSSTRVRIPALSARPLRGWTVCSSTKASTMTWTAMVCTMTVI